MLKVKIPLIFTLLFCVTSAVASFFATKKYIEERSESKSAIEDKSLVNCNVHKIRLNGYAYVKPLLLADENCPSEKFNQIRQQLQETITDFKYQGTIESASVYLRELNQGDWSGISENEKYLPGSLMKVPELITFMKMNEKNPGLLNKQIRYDKQMTPPKNAVYTSKSIQPGNVYTIKELLYYMIAYSDNNATMVLNSMMDLDMFKKSFTDLGMAEPDLSKKDIPLSAREFSLFMRAIYNASYLTKDDSEFSAELLSHSDFSTGLINGLPKNVKVVHKFGEAGDSSFAHFSESGIIYTNNSTYLLTVMTKGKDLKVLPGVVSQIANKAYSFIGSI